MSAAPYGLELETALEAGGRMVEIPVEEYRRLCALEQDRTVSASQFEREKTARLTALAQALAAVGTEMAPYSYGTRTMRSVLLDALMETQNRQYGT